MNILRYTDTSLQVCMFVDDLTVRGLAYHLIQQMNIASCEVLNPLEDKQ